MCLHIDVDSVHMHSRKLSHKHTYACTNTHTHMYRSCCCGVFTLIDTGIGGVQDIFTDDPCQPPTFLSLVGSVSRGFFL